MKLTDIKPLPVSIYFCTVLILTIAGAIISTYLLFSHYQVYTDVSYISFCAISKAINCDTVAQSPYSIFLDVPVAAWGIVGYILMFITILFALDTHTKKMRILTALMLMAFVFSSISLYLGILSGLKIHSYCIMCLLTHAINFLLFYFFWLIKRRYQNYNFLKSIKTDIELLKINKFKVMTFLLSFIILAGSLILFFPHYWKFTPTININLQINKGYTENGDPWIGAKNPEIVITEFSDYLCFQCKKMHFFLRALIYRYPNKLRLIHKHFPMDHKFNPLIKKPFHQGAGVMALIAIYASEQKKFWEINDFLFNYEIKSTSISWIELAEATHLEMSELQKAYTDPIFRKKLNQDIIYGLKHNISGTPAYIIDGEVYIGRIPPDILNPLYE